MKKIIAQGKFKSSWYAMIHDGKTPTKLLFNSKENAAKWLKIKGYK